MKITVFTSNQARHASLIERLSLVASEIWAVRECTTVHPGEVDDFFARSDTMQSYFAQVVNAERVVFGSPRFTPANVRELPIRMGDLNRLPLSVLAPALQSDVYLVFGSSYIKGELVDILVQRRCFNIHMGTSPYYRGSSTNFWSMYDERPEYTGATVHMLTKGLDSGPMLFHAFPSPRPTEPFELGMRAVEAAHVGFVERLVDGSLWDIEPVAQDRTLELRYTRNADFTDAIAAEYLGRLLPPDEIGLRLAARRLEDFLDPFVLEAD